MTDISSLFSVSPHKNLSHMGTDVFLRTVPNMHHIFYLFTQNELVGRYYDGTTVGFGFPIPVLPLTVLWNSYLNL